MLVSHRHHTPAAIDARLTLDRVIAEHLVLRRVEMRGVLQDERLLVAPWPETRSRLFVLFSGSFVAFANGRSWELAPGDAIVVDRSTELRTRGSGHTLEVDWDSETEAGEPLATSFEVLSLGARTIDAFESLSETLASIQVESLASIEPIWQRASDAARAEGIPLGARAMRDALARPRHPEQDVWSAIDRALCRIDQSPDTQDIVAELGWSRRTLARRLIDLDRRYRIYGDAGVEWRTHRDMYRLLLASIFLTHPHATTRGVATMVGYRSPEALCHAFANAGLPSPGGVYKMAR